MDEDEDPMEEGNNLNLEQVRRRGGPGLAESDHRLRGTSGCAWVCVGVPGAGAAAAGGRVLRKARFNPLRSDTEGNNLNPEQW